MSKRKRFAISESLSRGISETINVVQNNIGLLRYEIVSLDRIKTDPKNPRELLIHSDDIKKGINQLDPQCKTKEEELQNLEGLVNTIRKKGVINPIIVYKHQDHYRLVAGERRFLASLLANKKDIPVRIIDDQPSEFDLRLFQWIENNEREDLSLKERVNNLLAIVNGYRVKHKEMIISGSLLKEIVGFSKYRATQYLAIINASSDLKCAIDENKIQSVDKAAFIAGIKEKDVQKEVIQACIDGQSLNQLKSHVANRKRKAKSNDKKHKKQGRVATRVNLGFTKKGKVVRKIIRSVIDSCDYSDQASHFEGINWEDYSQVTQAFKRLIIILESEEKS